MANGLFGGGDGTNTNPFLVEDAQDLNAVRNYLGYVGTCFLQTHDIDMSSFGNFLPLKNDSSESGTFTGTYDGGGHKIINLLCKHNRDNVGLFGKVGASSKIRNIGLENIDVSGLNNVGGLVGYVSTSDISNCYSVGTVKGVTEVGGLVGSQNGNTLIKNCYTSGQITGYSFVGGIVGRKYSGGDIVNSFSLIDYIYRLAGSSNIYFGDIAGAPYTPPINCYSLNTLEFRQL